LLADYIAPVRTRTKAFLAHPVTAASKKMRLRPGPRVRELKEENRLGQKGVVFQVVSTLTLFTMVMHGRIITICRFIRRRKSRRGEICTRAGGSRH